jgi:predicted nucleotidyltransferase
VNQASANAFPVASVQAASETWFLLAWADIPVHAAAKRPATSNSARSILPPPCPAISAVPCPALLIGPFFERVIFVARKPMTNDMKREDVVRRLREQEGDLRLRGVTRAALFGSLARGEQRADSDIDILVELDPAIVRTIFDYSGVKDFISDLFDGHVDVVDHEALKPLLRPRVSADAIYAF